MCVYIHIAHIHHIIIYYVFFSYLLEASLYETNDLGVARDLWFMARDSPPLTQAVPSGGRSFLIETATVLVCMSWPYGEFRNGQRSLKKLEFPRQKRQWLRTWKCEYIYIYISVQTALFEAAACRLYACLKGSVQLNCQFNTVSKKRPGVFFMLSIFSGIHVSFKQRMVQTRDTFCPFARQPSRTMARTVPRTVGRWSTRVAWHPMAAKTQPWRRPSFLRWHQTDTPDVSPRRRDYLAKYVLSCSNARRVWDLFTTLHHFSPLSSKRFVWIVNSDRDPRR